MSAVFRRRAGRAAAALAGAWRPIGQRGVSPPETGARHRWALARESRFVRRKKRNTTASSTLKIA